METWREVRPEESRYNSLKKLRGSSTDDGKILMPSAYEQGAIRVVQREENDVCSGKYSLRLKADSFYMFGAFHGAYDARRGDVYVSRFMAKGKGRAAIHLTVYGGGSAYTLEQKGVPVPDKWTLIEQRILVGGASPDRIYPRLVTSGEVLIDDVYVARLLRDEERAVAKKVPKEYDARIAFASRALAPPAIDGRLDEESWKAAAAFSGFRVSGEQTELAASQPSFRILYDDKAFYVGVEIPLQDAERVLAELRANPSAGNRAADVYRDRHSIEIFLQPPGQARYVQYVASLDGYRSDCTGLGKENLAWKGARTHAAAASGDRWSLEVTVPAEDLKLDTIPFGEGWRLNVVANGPEGSSTWAAVGNNFHNPFAFGLLVSGEFPAWRQAKLQSWEAARTKLAAEGQRYGLTFNDRLERTANYSRSLSEATGSASLDWQQITRGYARMNFVDAVYRGMEAEIAYARMLSRR